MINMQYDIDQRDPYFDNLKMLLITFVALAHFIEGTDLTGNLAIRVLHSFIYLFHMPLFAFIAGWFTNDPQRAHKNAVATVLLPYILYQIGYAALHCFINDNAIYFNVLFMPAPGMWFLIALFVWRYTLADVLRFRHPLVLTAVISILSAGFLAPGIDEGQFLGMNRLLGFWFFFMLGHCLGRRPQAAERIREKTAPAAAILATIAVITYLLVGDASRYDFFRLLLSHKALASVVQFDEFLLVAVCYAVLLAVSAIASVCMMAIAPKRKNMLTYIGMATLPVYVSHFAVLRVIGFALEAFGRFPWWNTGLSFLFVLLSAFASVLAFSSKPYRTAFSYVTNLFVRVCRLDFGPFSRKQESE